MFVDRVQIEVHAGRGGNGTVAWRREKYIPKGGPSGGDGGKGGSIILLIDPNTYALDWFKHTRFIQAQNGGQGQGGCKKGKDGEDLILKIPPGTIVRDIHTKEVIFDAIQPHQKFVLCHGGKGGKGNFKFRSATNRAPNISTPGIDGQNCSIELELKMIADVGLVGYPNAGKTTLLSTIARRHDLKIGAYPFTTLSPNLGFIMFSGGHRVLIADIPGIIKGAHNDRGLGLAFLRHIERTHVIVYVLDAAGIDGRDPSSDFEILRDELSAYDPRLIERKSIIVLNKIDREEASENIALFKEKYRSLNIPIISVSCESQEGITKVKEEMKNIFFQNIV